MTIGEDDHWPSLPPIRTSSYNSRVSCETLNLHSPLGTAPAHPHTTSNTPLSTAQSVKPASKSADASPFGSTPSSSHLFSTCFPHKSSKSHVLEGKKGGAHTGRFDATGLLRSIFGFPVPRYTSPVMPYSTTNSPSGRMKASGATSPINLMRSGGTTPHSGVLLRSSKGHAAHAFTMMPPDVVGRKKPLDYESDEPTSPEVTCIGKVRRKHCKATWDALVKEKYKDVKKKGKVKKLSADIPQKSKFVSVVKKGEGGDSNTAAKLSNQGSGRRRSLDFEIFSSDLDAFIMPKQGESARGALVQGINDKAVAEMKQDAYTHPLEAADCESSSSFQSCSESIDTPKLSSPQGEDVTCEQNKEFGASFSERTAGANACTLLCEAPPPSNCLLLMKKGSRNRSAHYTFDGQLAQEQGHATNHWNWGQVLT